MSRADEVRELARRLVEAVMTTDEPIPQEILQGVRAAVHSLECQACELDEQIKRAATR